MTRPDAADADPRSLAVRYRMAHARQLMEEAVASLPPGDWLRLVIERVLAEDAERDDAADALQCPAPPCYDL